MVLKMRQTIESITLILSLWEQLPFQTFSQCASYAVCMLRGSGMLLTVIQCDSESFNAALPPKDPSPKFHRTLSESSAWVTRELWELYGSEYQLLLFISIWNISFSGYIQQYSLNYKKLFVIYNNLLHIERESFFPLSTLLQNCLHLVWSFHMGLMLV